MAAAAAAADGAAAAHEYEMQVLDRERALGISWESGSHRSSASRGSHGEDVLLRVKSARVAAASAARAAAAAALSAEQQLVEQERALGIHFDGMGAGSPQADHEIASTCTSRSELVPRGSLYVQGMHQVDLEVASVCTSRSEYLTSQSGCVPRKEKSCARQVISPEGFQAQYYGWWICVAIVVFVSLYIALGMQHLRPSSMHHVPWAAGSAADRVGNVTVTRVIHFYGHFR